MCDANQSPTEEMRWPGIDMVHSPRNCMRRDDVRDGLYLYYEN